MAKIDLLNLEETGMNGSLAGQKVLLFGSNDQGKTYQISKMHKPLLLMTEAGGNGVKCKKVAVTKWATFKDIVKQLTDEKTLEQMKEVYFTVIIDTLENLVGLAEQATCAEFGVRDLSEINGRQNGYSIYRKDFKTQVNKLCSAGYFVVFIDHEETVELEDPVNGEKYNFVQPKGSGNIKSSTRFVRDMCDFVAYAYGASLDENGDTIPSTLLCKQNKHAFARSRYAIQTFVKPFTAKNFEEAIIKAIEKSASDEGANLFDWKPNTSDYTAHDWIDMISPYYKAIYKKDSEKAKAIVENELGAGAKVSKATDEQKMELENIYNQMVTHACDMGLVVE